MGSAAAIADLFANDRPRSAVEQLTEGAVVVRGFALCDAAALVDAVGAIAVVSSFRHMTTPGGFRMSVAMTNCGEAGWITDRRGYRYSRDDPESGRRWPPMPALLRQLAERAAETGGFPGFVPDACLINRYEPETKLSLHRDEDERDLTAPVVSVSLGVSASFLWGGLTRKEPSRRIRLDHGDIVVWGGPARLVYHGIAPLTQGEHPLTGRCRINLTFRKAL